MIEDSFHTLDDDGIRNHSRRREGNDYMNISDNVRLSIFKVIELLMAIIICTLFAEALTEVMYVGRELGIYTGLASFLWVPVVLLVGVLTGKAVHNHINMVICFVLAVFALVGSALLIWKATETDNEAKRVIGITACVISVINCLILVFEILTDVIFEIAMKTASRSEHSYDNSY